jgi:hypothetical protein
MSLKKICCVAAAKKIPQEILQQPDYRELLHRSLPLKRQIKLFGEARGYYPDGHLKCRTIGGMRYNGGLELTYAPEGHLCRCKIADTCKDTILEIRFEADGSISKFTFYNPGGYGFQLTRKGIWCSLTTNYLGKSHGLNAHHTSPVSFYTMYENGVRIGTIFNNKDLD